jgi:hypothetical protein
MALLDTLSEIPLSALCVTQVRTELILLIDARGVGPDSNAAAGSDGGCPLQTCLTPALAPQPIPDRFRKGERVLDLEVELSLAAVLADTLDDVSSSGRRRRTKPSHRCLAQHGGNTGRGDACL